MRKLFPEPVLAVVLMTLSAACSPDDGAYKRPKVWPKPVDPPPASPIYHDVDEKVPGEEEIERAAAERPALLESEIERALKGDDLVRRETVMVYLLPELLQVEPQRLVALHARLGAGPERDRLGSEMAQYWAGSDAPAASRWIGTLEGAERRQAAAAAVDTLAAWEPRVALRLAEEFELGEAVRKRLSAITPRDPEPAAN